MTSPQTLEMEQRARVLLTRLAGMEAERINKLMDYAFESCNAEERSLTFSFPVEWWMLNPIDTMHGGLICTAFDIVLGTLTAVLSDGARACPTAQLNVTFLRPVTLDDRLIVTAKASHMGRTLGNLTGEARSQKTGKLCATASAVFFTGGAKRPPAAG